MLLALYWFINVSNSSSLCRLRSKADNLFPCLKKPIYSKNSIQ